MTVYIFILQNDQIQLPSLKLFTSGESVNLSNFLITLSMKSTAKTCPDVLASSPVKRPIPAPSSSTDFPSYEGSKDRTYRKEAPTYQNFKPTRLQSQEH